MPALEQKAWSQVFFLSLAANWVEVHPQGWMQVLGLHAAMDRPSDPALENWSWAKSQVGKG
jgi:hypothetical protein